MRNSLSRKTVVAILAFFLAISVGYAIFSETITIEGTATAQGDFSLTTTCVTSMSSDFSNAFGIDVEDLEENGYSNDSCIVDGNSVTMSAEFANPGAVRYFTVQVKNTTSVDVVTQIDSDGFLIVDNLITNLKVTETATGVITEKTYTGYNYDDYALQFPLLQDDLPGGFPAHINFVKLEDGTYLMGDEEYLEYEVFYKDGSGKKYMKLSPNETLTILFSVGWGENSTVQGYTAETKFNFPINFEQLSDDMEVDTDIETCLFGC